MSIVSFEFLLFLSIAAIGYYITPKGKQWIVLLVANALFYILAGITYVPFLVYTIITTYVAARHLAKKNGQMKKEMASLDAADRDGKRSIKAQYTKKKKCILILYCIANIGIWAVVKYSGFLVENLNACLAVIGLPQLQVSTDFILPLGISFYTLQAVGYIVDVYRDKADVEKNILKSALFLSFFPQMVQGPVSRYKQLAHQLTAHHCFDYDRIKQGGLLILWGFFKKLVIAETVGVISNWVFNPVNQASGVYILLGAIAYSLRVYTDFSGGIDVARGAAQILDIELEQNFKRPYFSSTITEFWRRWHITLGSWFRDYVFYPLSLSKGLTKLGKKSRALLGNNIGKIVPVLIAQFVVFTLIGLWHGANWTYIAFGFYHGFLIVGSILFESTFKNINAKLKIQTETWYFRAFRIARTVVLVVVGRILTMGTDLRMSLIFVRNMLKMDNFHVIVDGSLLNIGLDRAQWCVLGISLLILLTVSLIQEKGVHIRTSLSEKSVLLQWPLYLALIFAILIFGVYGYGYSSSDFIYRGF